MKNAPQSDTKNLGSCIIYLVWCGADSWILSVSVIHQTLFNECKFNRLQHKLIELISSLIPGRFICSSQHLPRSSPTHKGEPTTQRTRYDKSSRRNYECSISWRSWLDPRLRASTADLQIHRTPSTTSLCIHSTHDDNGESQANRNNAQV